jgi:outer membrane biosynthesis protein TonB
MGTALLLTLAMMGQVSAPIAPAATAPTDDYGYVSWCYGALGGYLDLYDKVMPEVTRIEKAFPGPDGVAASLKTYPEMRAQARLDLKTFTSAITAAEKASPRPIADYGRAAINKGRTVWAGSETVNKARLAQVWMSWSPPGDCETRAKTLEKRSNVLGKALIYNAAPTAGTKPEPAPELAPPSATTEPLMEQAPPPPKAVVKETPKPAPTVAKPVAKPPAAKTPVAKPVATKPAAPKPAVAKPAATPPMMTTTTTTTTTKPAAKAEIIIDYADPKPCAGRLEPAKRNGKDVLICKPD